MQLVLLYYKCLIIKIHLLHKVKKYIITKIYRVS
jgi:hypothetical protein